MTRSYEITVSVDVTPDHADIKVANLDVTGFQVSIGGALENIPLGPNCSIALRDAIERAAQHKAAEDDWSDD